MNDMGYQVVPPFANFNPHPHFIGNLQQSFPGSFGNFPNQQDLNFQVRGQAQKLNHVRPNKNNTFYQQQVSTSQPAAHIKLQAPQVPTLNEILAQLHQDPGFRQRYKEYCRAVLDGRFMGNIKNPIHPLFDQNKKAMQQDQLGNKNLFFEQISNNRNEEKQSVHPYMLNKTYHVMNMQQQQQNMQNGQAAAQGGKMPQTLMINHNQLSYLENNRIPHSVTLLSNNNRQQQVKQVVGPQQTNQKYGSVNQQSQQNQSNVGSKVSIPIAQHKHHSHQQQRRQHLPQKMDTISHQPMNNNPTISEAAYFIQRVNRILQTQGHSQNQQSNGGHVEKQAHTSYGQNLVQHNQQSSVSSGLNQAANPLQQSQIYTSTSQMKQYNINQHPNQNLKGKNLQTNPYLIIGSSENGQSQYAVRSLSYHNNGQQDGLNEGVLVKLNTGPAGKREMINRHEQRYGSTTNHTGLLNLPRAQKNNIKQTYLQEALKMKEQRTLQIQQKSQSNLVQFVPVQYPSSPGTNPLKPNEQLTHGEYMPMGNQNLISQQQQQLVSLVHSNPEMNQNEVQHLLKQQQKQMLEHLKNNLSSKQNSGINKQFTERNTMNATQAIPHQESFNKNKVISSQTNPNVNYGVTVYSRSQMAQKIEQGASQSISLINKHGQKRPSNQFQDYPSGQEMSQMTPNTKGSFVAKK